MSNYFQAETAEVLAGWDGSIKLRSVPGKADLMELLEPLPCGDDFIPAGFRYNGASSGVLRHLPIIGFPKWKHPVDTCKHDWRCLLAKTKKQRKIADQLFGSGVGKSGTKWEQIKGYVGVRIGAFFGVGVPK